MIYKQPFDLLVASCAPDGGIYRYQIGNGQPKILDFAPMDRTMYMAREAEKPYVLLRECFPDGCSGLISCNLLPDGTLSPSDEILSTMGKVACQLCIDRGQIYVVNYIGGSAVRIPDQIAQRSGSSIHPQRQCSAHPHCITPTPDGKKLLLTDLGTDQICIYDRELRIIDQISMVPGSGPRHLTFDKSGNYVLCANELNSTVSVLKYQSNTLQYLYSCTTLPDNFRGENTAGAIRCVKDRIYISNRGHDSVAEFLFCDERLQLQRYLPIYGQCPRDIWIHEDLLIVANQHSGNISLIDITTGKLLESISVPTPLCVLTT